jgi:hypothetical protein
VPFPQKLAVVTIQFRDFSNLRKPRLPQLRDSRADLRTPSCQRTCGGAAEKSLVSAQKVRDPLIAAGGHKPLGPICHGLALLCSPHN